MSRPAALVGDGGVYLTGDLAQKYRIAMAAVLRQARDKHPGAVVPADIEFGQQVLALAVPSGTGSGTEFVVRSIEPEPLSAATGSAVESGFHPPYRPAGLSVAETAALAGVSERGVRKAIEDGRLPATRQGRSWSVPEDEALRWVAQRRQAA